MLKDVELKVAEVLGRSGLDACLEAVFKDLHEAPYSHDEVRDGKPLFVCFSALPFRARNNRGQKLPIAHNIRESPSRPACLNFAYCSSNYWRMPR
jgi:hypothetical protein